MKILNQFQIEQTAGIGSGREVLEHVLIERLGSEDPWLSDDCNGVAVAADGFCMAVVPVLLDPEDTPGLLPATLFKGLRDAAGESLYEVNVILGENSLSYLSPDGGVTIKYDACEKTFPVYREIISKHVSAGTDPFFLQPRVLRKVAKAIGASGVRLGLATMNTPILVRPYSGLGEGDKLVPPFGVLMPMSASR